MMDAAVSVCDFVFDEFEFAADSFSFLTCSGCASTFLSALMFPNPQPKAKKVSIKSA